MMRLVSTRGGEAVSPRAAVLSGIAPDGGLYVPEKVPAVSMETLQAFARMPYEKVAAHVLSLYFDEIPKETMEEMCHTAYASFQSEDTIPVVPLDGKVFAMELFHGPTLAFKDVALQMLPLLMHDSMQSIDPDDKVLILVATSGDTGKAALEGFANKPGCEITVFYPNGGVSQAQRMQMVTQQGDNVSVFAVEGNFDDCQRGVKQLMGDQDFLSAIGTKGYHLSSANSINFGRLAPQIAYYFWAYAQLLKKGEITLGEAVDFVVPTGNFGNILAAYYAKRMGLPCGTLVCASNVNNVLSRFFASGVYDSRPPLEKTTSPSMDILVSSNLERMLFEACGRDAEQVKAWMQSLASEKQYDVGAELLETLRSIYFGGWADDAEAAKTIRETYEAHGYLLDTHSAVGMAVYRQYSAQTQSNRKAVLACTASPYKFSSSVLSALTGEEADAPVEVLPELLAQASCTKVPEAISALWDKPVLHQTCCAPQDMKQTVLDRLER